MPAIPARGPARAGNRGPARLERLAQLPFARGCNFLAHFGANAAAYRAFYEHAEPYAAYQLLPKPAIEWSPFRKLLLLLALRFDKVVPAVGTLMTQLPEFGPSFSCTTTSNTVTSVGTQTMRGQHEKGYST